MRPHTFLRSFEPPPKFRRGDSNHFRKHSAVIIGVVKAGCDCDFRNRTGGMHQMILAELDADLVYICIDIHRGPFFEDPAQVGRTAMAEIGELIYSNALAAVLLDIFDRMRQDHVFIRIMISEDICGGRMGLAEDPIRVAEILCEKIQLGQQIFDRNRRYCNVLVI